MRYTRLRVWVIFFVVVVGVIVVLQYSAGGSKIYRSAHPITDSLLTETYPDLYQAVEKRDVQQLRPFLMHSHPQVRDQAWRAFANTPVDSLAPFLDLAKEQNLETAWFAISSHSLSENQLRELEQNWIENPELRIGIARVLGRQGDRQSLNFLVEHLKSSGLSDRFTVALATGRMIRRFDLEREQQIMVLQSAFDTENYQATRAYLYGWYRGDASRLSAAAKDTLFNRWQVMGMGLRTEVDQFVNKILPERTTQQMTIYYNGEQLLDSETQLSVELATSLEKLPLNDQNSLAAKILLTNANSHVQVRTLQSISDKLTNEDDLFEYIRDSMVPDSTLASAVWLQAVETGLSVDSSLISGNRNHLDQIAEKNIYLLPQVLAIYADIEPVDAYLDRITRRTSEENPLSALFAVQALSDFWKKFPDSRKTKSRTQAVRNIVFNALDKADRGVAYGVQPLLQDEVLFTADDFKRINSYLQSFSLPGDIEVFQAFGRLYKDRFEQQAKPVIDSLAALKNTPLNRSLAEAGWSVEVPQSGKTEFRLPNWKRLWQLGRHPVWTLRTEKGPIEIRLNTLDAPATVSMIDSLSRAGAYAQIPFHRVVPNFVIQGGDIERKDGFGGPDFVVPTEASEQGFSRGTIGIASAGPDTEGSQYFIMNQWKPHLNGRYTRFGEVINGMDIADKIIVGDKVLSTTWY